MKRVIRSDWKTQPWKNGGGITHEVFRWWASRADTSEFDLRLSVAEIGGAQAFSRFDGYERALVPLDENALTLVIDGVPSPMTRHRCFHFAGTALVETVGKGRARDFNVMSRSERRARVEVGIAESARDARQLAVFALTPVALHGDDGSTLRLDEFETLIALRDESNVALTASTPVIWIRF